MSGNPTFRELFMARVRPDSGEADGEASLREWEARYRLLFENNLAGVFRSHVGEGVADCNDTFARIFGYGSREEIIGRRGAEFYFNDADRQTFHALLKKEGALTNFEMRMRRKDGGEVWVLENVVYRESKDGSPAVAEGTVVDITERKRTENELRVSEERYRALIENSPLAMLAADADGKVVLCNSALERMFQYRPEDVIGRNIDESLTPPDLQAEAREFSRRVLAGETVHATTRRRRRDGSSVEVELHAVPLIVEGTVVGAYGMYGDISERRELEDHLRQAQKMEAVGRLAGGVAHDFNNLLTAITGYAELALLRLDHDNPVRKNLNEIQKAAERAATLTRQLLAFSRKQVVAPRLLDPVEVVNRMDGMLRRLIGEHIELITISGTRVGRIRADQGQIEQVILNLALNARDAMPQAGALTIETANVDLDVAYARRHAGVLPGPYVMISISDTGCGMDAETQRRIFEPFFTTKEQGQGTGLGLSTVYGIVAQNGGNIWFHSEVGKGTTFKIYLPRDEKGIEAVEQEHSATERPRGIETLLLVEDEQMVREMASELLRMCGYTVLSAGDGVEALALCERQRGVIHLMITDVVMPRMGGRELVESVMPLRPALRVLYISGHTEDAIVQQGIKTRGVPFLQKPFTLDDFARKVREVLDAPV